MGNYINKKESLKISPLKKKKKKREDFSLLWTKNGGNEKQLWINVCWKKRNAAMEKYRQT